MDHLTEEIINEIAVRWHTHLRRILESTRMGKVNFVLDDGEEVTPIHDPCLVTSFSITERELATQAMSLIDYNRIERAANSLWLTVRNLVSGLEGHKIKIVSRRLKLPDHRIMQGVERIVEDDEISAQIMIAYNVQTASYQVLALWAGDILVDD